VRRVALALIVLPGPAAAHEAFGDLGPFYQALLHPFADLSQALFLLAAATLLARQPIATVRSAYAALAAGGLVALGVGQVVTLPVPDLRVILIAALVVALAGLLGAKPPARVAAVLAFLAGCFASLPLVGGSGGYQTVLGGAAGIALVTLFLWGAAETADRRLSPFATSVAAAWVAATALMVVVLPA
jgi:hypothetical protein